MGKVIELGRDTFQLDNGYWVDYDCFDKVDKKKMTVSEICKELGYDVEIVKEDNE